MVMKPLEASATTIAMPMAIGAPIMGMKAPMNTSTASGAASGTPTIWRKMPAIKASVSATMTVPRAYPAKVYQPAPAARCTDLRMVAGSSLRNQRHMRPPEARKKIVEKSASASTAKTSATVPALDSTWVARVGALDCT